MSNEAVHHMQDNPSQQLKSQPWQVAAWQQLISRPSAKIGLIWIAMLSVLAALAPFIANSHPVFMVHNGQASSPLINHLQPADWVWLAALFLVVILYKAPLPPTKKILIGVLGITVTTILAYSFVSPPILVTYEQYREQEAAGQLSTVIRVPIPYSPKDYLRDYAQQLNTSGTENVDTGLEAPLAADDRTHLFGTDENGSDVASRMIHAARIALGIGFIATGIALVIGTIIGGLMGYFSGVVDMLGMRLVEIFESIPTLFLLLSFVAFFGRSIYMMMVIIGITSWSGYARYVRAEFLKLRQQDFVQAATVCGLPLRSILFRHMLPNGMAPLLVATSFGVASAILAEATLSFLGLGLIDDPSWGQLLNQAVQSSTFNWWLAVFPGGAIFMTVFAYNLLGEAMRDAVDPHTRGEQ